MNASSDVLARHRWTVVEYRRMAQNGTLAPDARVELIDGEIIDMPPVGSLHAGTVGQLTRILDRAVGDAALVWVQNPIELSDSSEPEPDLTLLKPRDDFYKRALPRSRDIVIAIEVADSTLPRDLHVKRSLYARHGVSEYWIVDVGGKRLLTFSDPSGDDYSRETVVTDLRAVPVEALDGVTVDLRHLFD